MKYITVLILFMFFAVRSQAQYNVFFCSKLDSLGKCVGQSSEFKWTGEKMPVELILESKTKITTSKLNFKIFLLNNDRDAVLAGEISTYPKPNALSAAKKLYFFKPGNYKVEVYDTDRKLLTTGNLTITDR